MFERCHHHGFSLGQCADLYRAFKPILPLFCGWKERRDSRVLIPSIPISINIYLDHSRRSQF
jgi:hypothetical protein